MRLEIDGEHTNVKFSACHFIAGHEKCGRLHGHTYVVSLRIHGDIGEKGMVMDFVQIKRGLRSIVDDLDHRVLIPGNSKRITVSVGDEVVVLAGCKRYVFPVEDVVLLDTEESSAEELSRVLLQRLIGSVRIPRQRREHRAGHPRGAGSERMGLPSLPVIAMRAVSLLSGGLDSTVVLGLCPFQGLRRDAAHRTLWSETLPGTGVGEEGGGALRISEATW